MAVIATDPGRASHGHPRFRVGLGRADVPEVVAKWDAAMERVEDGHQGTS
jgi:hypothetical protein